MIPRSLTSRLIFLYCIILLLLGAAFLGSTVLSFRHYARQVITNILAVRTQDIWRVAQDEISRPDRLKPIMERRFSPESQDRFIRIQVDGKTVYQSGEPLSGYFSPRDIPLTLPGPEKQVQPVGDVTLYTQSFTGRGYRKVVIQTGQFQYAHTVEEQLTKSLLIGLPILLLIAAIAGYLVMRRALTPVESMIRAAESYTFNDPQKRLPTTGNEPRIEALGQALNRMLDRLDSAYSHVNRFTSDAAHELRTPLTIIRGELELIARQEKLPPDVDDAIRTVLEEMTRLSNLVDNLINLSRMDSLWGKTAHDTVDLLDLSLETIDQMHLLLEEKDITVTRPKGPAVQVPGDRGRLKQVLVNLLNNAIKYTAPGGQIEIQIFTEGTKAVVTVEDSGMGIDPKHHQRVFDRFYRVSPDRGADGAGLGLAIVKSICQAHGGTVSVRSVPSVGSCFVVEIPLSTAAISSSSASTADSRRLQTVS